MHAEECFAGLWALWLQLWGMAIQAGKERKEKEATPGEVRRELRQGGR